MNTYYMDGIYEEIEGAVRVLQRNLRRGVLPKHVQPQLPYARAEGSIRRDMGQMWFEGRLVRVNGRGARKGYRLASEAERVAFVGALDVMLFAGRVDAVGLSVRLGCGEVVAALVLDWLAELGKVIRLGDGLYRVPSLLEKMAWERYGFYPFGMAA